MTFDEKLEEIELGGDDGYGIDLLVNYPESIQAIKDLILSDVIGENEKHPAWCGTNCDDVSHVTNSLRNAQRTIVEGSKR